MSTEASPRPWELTSPFIGVQPVISGSDGLRSCVATDAANAALIVKAVNSHEALVAALEWTAGAVAGMAKGLELPEHAELTFTGKWAHHGSMTIGAILDAADAALGKAGEQP